MNGPPVGAWLALAAALTLPGCEDDRVQSTLHPSGPAAQSIAWLTWVMIGVYGGVFMVTLLMLLAALAWRRTRHNRPPLGTVFVFVSGIAIPALILIVMLVLTVSTTVALRPPPTEFTIRVRGHMWWWHVEYPQQGIVTANEVHIPVGVPVAIELDSADVVHSFWVPNLAGKTDLMPGNRNVMWLQADKPGVYRGQCAEYCGLQHAWMAFDLVALPRKEFDAWVAAKQEPVTSPQNAEAERGFAVYFAAGCSNCHAIRGTPAVGRVGPDLTHLASRRTLAAGRIPNTEGHLAGWILNPQELKPGNLMPPTYLPPEDLHALVTYLRSLK